MAQKYWLNRNAPPHVMTLVAIAGIAALNMNIFLPSLPSMSEYFDAEYATVQLAVSAYLGVTALLQIIIGPLSDRYGRRPVLLGGLTGFVFATIGCLIAPTIEIFLAFRMLQAVIAAGMVLSRAIIRDMVPPSEAASMIGYVTMGMSLIPMIGPAIGGVLNEVYGWHASFLMVLGLAILVLGLAWADLGETNTTKSTSFGAQFRAYPDLIRSRRFWGYTMTAAFSSGAFFAFLGGAPYVSIQVLGLDSVGMGFYFIYVAAGYTVGNFLSGRFSSRYGVNRMMLTGCSTAMTGVSISTLLFLAGIYHPLSLFAPMFIVGLGNGMTLPNANAGIVSVRPHLAGSASGLGGAMMIGGGAILSAITGAMLGPDTPVFPLILMMLAVSALSIVSSLMVIQVAKSAGELGADGFGD